MPWAFIPVLMLITMMQVQGISWGYLVAIALSAWLGQRHGRSGVFAVAIAWFAMSFQVQAGNFSAGLRWDVGLTAVLLAYVCAQSSPAGLLRTVFEQAARARTTWLLVLAAPLVVRLAIISSGKQTNFGAAIGINLLVVLTPLLAVASRAPRSIYFMLAAYVGLSIAGQCLELGLPFPRFMPGRGLTMPQTYMVYGIASVDSVFVGVALALAGLAIRRCAEARRAPQVLLVPALLMVALAPYSTDLYPGNDLVMNIINTTKFAACGALLAGVAAGTMGWTLALAVIVASCGLLAGWLLTDAPWLNELQAYSVGQLFVVGVDATSTLYLPILVAIFGIVGAEVRAVALASKTAQTAA